MSGEDKEYPSIEPIYLVIHSNLLTSLNLLKQEQNWFMTEINKKVIKGDEHDKQWQSFAERIREILFIAKQSMTAEQYVRFKALVKLTLGTGYISRLDKLLKKSPKKFLDFDEATL